jgi:uncharacterized protein with HEPN domain
MRSNENGNDRIIQKILTYCKKITAIMKKHNESFAEFESNDEFYGSVSMFEMQIGELSNHLTVEFRNETKDIIPWRSMKGMRNLYAHEYDKMEAKDIWSAALEDIPKLTIFCESYLNKN